MVTTRTEANQLAFEKLTASEPILRDIRPAIEVLPGMTATVILTSGVTMPWGEYTGGQREAIIGGALFEGLAEGREEAIHRLDNGEIPGKRLPGLRLCRLPCGDLHGLHAGLCRRKSHLWQPGLLQPV